MSVINNVADWNTEPINPGSSSAFFFFLFSPFYLAVFRRGEAAVLKLTGRSFDRCLPLIN